MQTSIQQQEKKEEGFHSSLRSVMGQLAAQAASLLFQIWIVIKAQGSVMSMCIFGALQELIWRSSLYSMFIQLAWSFINEDFQVIPTGWCSLIALSSVFSFYQVLYFPNMFQIHQKTNNHKVNIRVCDKQSLREIQGD